MLKTMQLTYVKYTKVGLTEVIYQSSDQNWLLIYISKTKGQKTKQIIHHLIPSLS
jgi:hypothetical protein